MSFGLPRLSVFDAVVLVVQTLFGAWYLIHGLNYFCGFFDQPTGGELIPALIRTHLFAFIKLTEIGVGVLLLAHLFVPLAIAVAAPVTVVIAWVNRCWRTARSRPAWAWWCWQPMPSWHWAIGRATVRC